MWWINKNLTDQLEAELGFYSLAGVSQCTY